ncbi:7-hydroxymethyl chlorophyll a reductase, chloroplastic [Symbiodinium microadriaticum]|uniref:7-hydroxymethyl chlorophyll a reductase, chloroplastic n=1 Tax=Symbiodinium microadriaticum TaxID=2951 RepID=A0A1Q9F471_SYMMI|nr:7-hydroxymethyl chlorophyll a reductase, chloroplastic [Symbiodinium microadriaticum]
MIHTASTTAWVGRHFFTETVAKRWVIRFILFVKAPLEPKPILARTVEEVLASGGVKPMLSPNLLPLEELWEVRGQDIRKLLFIGVGCQVQALRSVEEAGMSFQLLNHGGGLIKEQSTSGT